MILGSLFLQSIDLYVRAKERKIIFLHFFLYMIEELRQQLSIMRSRCQYLAIKLQLQIKTCQQLILARLPLFNWSANLAWGTDVPIGVRPYAYVSSISGHQLPCSPRSRLLIHGQSGIDARNGNSDIPLGFSIFGGLGMSVLPEKTKDTPPLS